MKLFQYAVASIVDANTGNGLPHYGNAPDYSVLEQRGREIRSRSITDLLAHVKTRLVTAVTDYRTGLKQRRDLRSLQRLNDHLLEDVGLTRADLYSVELGATSLAELNASRLSARSDRQLASNRLAGSEAVDQKLEASNEALFVQQKCA